jgi:hypothetical protein
VGEHRPGVGEYRPGGGAIRVVVRAVEFHHHAVE